MLVFYLILDKQDWYVDFPNRVISFACLIATMIRDYSFFRVELDRTISMIIWESRICNLKLVQIFLSIEIDTKRIIFSMFRFSTRLICHVSSLEQALHHTAQHRFRDVMFQEKQSSLWTIEYCWNRRHDWLKSESMKSLIQKELNQHRNRINLLDDQFIEIMIDKH